MKNSQSYEKTFFNKKINRFNKKTSSVKKIDSSNNVNYPLIINRKNNTYQNSKENLNISSNKTNSPKKTKEIFKRENSFNYAFPNPRVKEKKVQVMTSQENESFIKKISPKDILMRRVSKFLFSKKKLKSKLKEKLEKDNFMQISNNSNNSFNLINYKRIKNLKFLSLNETPNMVSVAHTTRNFIANNNSTKLNKFKCKLFKYNLSKQKNKIEKLLLDIKKSELMEIRLINQKLLKLKAKTFNSKTKKNDLKN